MLLFSDIKSLLYFILLAMISSFYFPPEIYWEIKKNGTDKPIIWIDRYGAEGNGITDDTKAFQRAIDALPYGGTIILGNKTYLAGIRITHPGITLIGSGGQSTIRPTGNVTILVADSNAIIKNLHLLGDGKKNYGVVVLVRGKNCLIDSCDISHGRAGIDTENNDNPFVSQNLMVKNCYIHNLNGFGIHVRNRKFDTLYMADARIYNNTIDNCSGAVNFDCISDVTIDSNRIINNIATSAINNQDRPVGIKNILIKNNIIKNGLPATGNSIEFQHVDGVIITDNKFLQGGYRDGIQIDYSASKSFIHDSLTPNYNKNIIIKGNDIIFRGDYHKPFSLAGIKLNNCSTVSLLDNTVGYYNSLSKNNDDNGIVLYTCENVVVYNNIVNGNNLAGKRNLAAGIVIGYHSSGIYIHQNAINNTLESIKKLPQIGSLIEDQSKFHIVSNINTFSVPTSAEYKDGDIIINPSPENGSPIGWKVVGNKMDPIGASFSFYLKK